MFSSEFREISKNTCFTEHLRATASEWNKLIETYDYTEASFQGQQRIIILFLELLQKACDIKNRFLQAHPYIILS